MLPPTNSYSFEGRGIEKGMRSMFSSVGVQCGLLDGHSRSLPYEQREAVSRGGKAPEACMCLAREVCACLALFPVISDQIMKRFERKRCTRMWLTKDESRMWLTKDESTHYTSHAPTRDITINTTTNNKQQQQQMMPAATRLVCLPVTLICERSIPAKERPERQRTVIAFAAAT